MGQLLLRWPYSCMSPAVSAPALEPLLCWHWLWAGVLGWVASCQIPPLYTPHYPLTPPHRTPLTPFASATELPLESNPVLA